jgi:hypothetical protein
MKIYGGVEVQLLTLGKSPWYPLDRMCGSRAGQYREKRFHIHQSSLHFHHSHLLSLEKHLYPVKILM